MLTPGFSAELSFSPILLAVIFLTAATVLFPSSAIIATSENDEDDSGNGDGGDSSDGDNSNSDQPEGEEASEPQPQSQPQPLPQQQQQLQQPQQPQQQTPQSSLRDFILSGKINSLLPTENNTWIADGNWNLVAENGSAKKFTTQMTWTSADGIKSHIHEFQNFVHASNETNVAISRGDTLVLDGTMDVGTNGIIDWQGVPTRLYFGNGQTLVVALDDEATNSHFGNQPVFGLVTSFTPCGSPGPSMEVLPRCE